MRKIYSMLLCIVMLMQMTIITVFAAAATVTVANVNGTAGETVDVTVDLTNCAGFMNLGLEFGYDASVLTLEKVTNGATGAMFTKAPTLTTNPYNLTWNSTENVVHSGTLVTLQFKIADNAANGTYPITVDYYKGPNGTSVDGKNVNYDENFQSLGLSYVSGGVTVGGNSNNEPQGAYVKVNNTSAKSGETVNVTVDLTNCAGFMNLGLEFGYDASVLTLEKVTNGATGAMFTKAPTLTTNPYNLTWNSTENVVHSGTLVTLQFKIADNAANGTYPITVDYYKGPNGTSVDGKNVNYDENFQSLGLSYVSGNVVVKPQKHILSVEKTEDDSKINLKIKASSPNEISGVIIAALYGDSRLVKVEIVDAQDSVDIPFTDSGEKIKVMWWNSLTQLVPLCDFVELNLGDN